MYEKLYYTTPTVYERRKLMVQLLQEDREDFVVKMSDLCALEDAGIEDAHLARRPIDREHVISLLLSDARKWPPILVTKTDLG